MTDKKAVERGRRRARTELERIKDWASRNPRAAEKMLESAERRGILEPCETCGKPTALDDTKHDYARGRVSFRTGGKTTEVHCQECWVRARKGKGPGRVETAASRVLRKVRRPR